jgi:pimeloyl-ACP methyl ester carboxylesterase
VPELEANGLRVAYLVEGEGPPLVLLHAATSSATEDWAAQRPLLRQHFRLYLPDARGHAGTRWDSGRGWDHDMLLADLVAFADGLGLERFHVAGLSMGAGTALAFAIRHPERALSAVLAAVAVEPEPRNRVARQLMDPERADPAWAARLARRHDPVQGEGAWRQLLVAIRGDILRQRHPRPDELLRARLPILVATGDRDPWVPLEQTVRLHRQLPDASLFVAPGVGHVITAERPSLFNQAMLQFLRSVEARASKAADGC